jgi:hypothetical protein
LFALHSKQFPLIIVIIIRRHLVPTKREKRKNFKANILAEATSKAFSLLLHSTTSNFPPILLTHDNVLFSLIFCSSHEIKFASFAHRQEGVKVLQKQQQQQQQQQKSAREIPWKFHILAACSL